VLKLVSGVLVFLVKGLDFVGMVFIVMVCLFGLVIWMVGCSDRVFFV